MDWFADERCIQRPQTDENFCNQKEVETIAEALQIETMQGWYSVQQTEVLEKGGRGLLHIYGNSLIKALESVYEGKCLTLLQRTQ